jgi:hypothetical protein
MDPMTITAILSAIPQLTKMGIGIGQNAKANRLMESNVRPDYEIPAEMQQTLDLVKMMTTATEMPGQSLLEGKLDAQFANQTQDIKDVSVSSADALSSIVNAGGRQQMVMADIGYQAASRKDSMNQLLMQTLGNMATYRDKAWELNKLQPYLDTANTASAMKQGGMTNLYSGLEGLSRAAGGYLTAKAQMGQDVPVGGDGATPDLPDGTNPNDMTPMTPRSVTGYGGNTGGLAGGTMPVPQGNQSSVNGLLDALGSSPNGGGMSGLTPEMLNALSILFGGQGFQAPSAPTFN